MKRLLALLCASCIAGAWAQTPGTAAVPPAAAPAASAPAQPLPPARWTTAQARDAFQLADVNGDGQLSRAEAQRLAIMPRSFEETDTNKDGVLTLQEYLASFAGS